MDPFPYCGAAPVPAEIAARWNLDPVLLAAMAALAAAQALWIARQGADAGRGSRFAAFGAAWTLGVVLFVSPFCALASALFSAREAHHMLLVAVIAPLLVLAGPDGRKATRFAIGGAGLLAAGLAHAIILWFWHAPAAYAAALADDRVYWLMQLSLLGSALALWRGVLSPMMPAGQAVAALAGTVMQTALLGALLTFSRAPFYADHFGVTAPWGLSPLEDQQLAGALMWALGAAPYLVALLTVLALRLLTPAAQADKPGRSSVEPGAPPLAPPLLAAPGMRS